RAGPTDAAVIRPRLDSARGMALSCGLAPEIGNRDPYWMAVSAIDEAVRNVVCVGGDPRRAAILDNFCWPSSEDPRALGALVRACQACYDTATAYGLPFISGKDSLNNVFAMSEAEAARVREAIAKRRHRGEPAIEWSTARDRCRLSIPFTLLISAVALVDDVARCITSLPRVAEGQTANLLFVGFDADGWDGIELAAAARLHLAVADLIREGGARAVHDVSDGGIAVAVAEMAFGGDFDVNYHLPAEGRLSDPFARPPSAYIVQPAWDPDAVRARFEAVSDLRIEPVATLAPSGPDGLFRFVRGKSVLAEEPISALRHAWRQPLDW
ncbi:MAG: AIR synthase related protein, partial [Phycisphaerae bacterium]